MKVRILDGESQFLRNGQESLVGRHKGYLDPVRRWREREGTRQLDGVISPKRIAEKEIHGLVDDHRLWRDQGVARGEFAPERSQRLVSLRRAELPGAPLPHDCGEHLNSGERGNEDARPLVGDKLSDPFTPDFPEVALHKRAGIKEVGGHLARIPLVYDQLGGRLARDVDGDKVGEVGRHNGGAAFGGREAEAEEFFVVSFPGLFF